MVSHKFHALVCVGSNPTPATSDCVANRVVGAAHGQYPTKLSELRADS